MRDTSTLFDKLWGMPHTVETMVDISGVTYDNTEIFSRRIYGGVFEEPTVGTCASRTLELSIMPKATIPRGAKIIVYARLRAEDEVSEWLTQGTFFISTRQRDKVTGCLSIVAYDAMRKANAVWWNNSYAEVNFPMSETAAVADIASRMGITVDERTALDNLFPVQFPVDENGDLTMWTILCGIAASNAGSWVISADNKLLFLRYGDLPPETSYLVNETGKAIVIGGVILRV